MVGISRGNFFMSLAVVWLFLCVLNARRLTTIRSISFMAFGNSWCERRIPTLAKHWLGWTLTAVVFSCHAKLCQSEIKFSQWLVTVFRVLVFPYYIEHFSHWNIFRNLSSSIPRLLNQTQSAGVNNLLATYFPSFQLIFFMFCPCKFLIKYHKYFCFQEI